MPFRPFVLFEHGLGCVEGFAGLQRPSEGIGIESDLCAHLTEGVLFHGSREITAVNQLKSVDFFGLLGCSGLQEGEKGLVTRTAGTIAAADALYTLMQQSAALVGFFGVAAVEREKFIVLCGKLERQTLYITQPDCGFADVFDALMPGVGYSKGRASKYRFCVPSAYSVV